MPLWKHTKQADRLILCNYRIKPDALEHLLPHGTRARIHNGRAFGGVTIKNYNCQKYDITAYLMGYPYEVILHSIAIEWDESDETKNGLAILALHNSSRVAAFLSKKTYPIKCLYTQFEADEHFTSYQFKVNAQKHEIYLQAGMEPHFSKESFFTSAREAGNFFQESLIHQHSSNQNTDRFFQSLAEGQWTCQALHIKEFTSQFFEDNFDEKDIEFDHAIMMKKIEPSWCGSIVEKQEVISSSFALNQKTVTKARLKN
ncbi:hypothetical protein PQO03_03765 [Lentisphaera profundi]|uniref:DUF2071 domain-containing protein n=1 Tax=Lentisphaera profundi TaxID=1658616 RepID=A0ABY7VTL8_9BACT|nr:hypothetical protein [Lentisphaera profundi]WDE97072.1 hypothetical protein PQO03_03765 [Lentisphaera profundi]